MNYGIEMSFSAWPAQVIDNVKLWLFLRSRFPLPFFIVTYWCGNNSYWDSVPNEIYLLGDVRVPPFIIIFTEVQPEWRIILFRGVITRSDGGAYDVLTYRVGLSYY